MSFILEALKKSAREREKGSIPTLETDHQPDDDLHFTPTSRGNLKKVVALAVFCCLCIGLFFLGKTIFFPSAPPVQPPGSPQHPQLTPDTQPVAVPPANQEFHQPLPPPTKLQQTRDNPTTIQPIPAWTEPGQKKQISLLKELPPSIRDQIPPLHFAGHVYSENPAQRMIMINNTIVREQESIQKVRLQTITMDGVILEFHNHVFRVSLF